MKPNLTLRHALRPIGGGLTTKGPGTHHRSVTQRDSISRCKPTKRKLVLKQQDYLLHRVADRHTMEGACECPGKAGGGGN